MITTKVPSILYGGDYNAEQWPEEIWLEDMRLMKLAGVNLVTVGVFGWALLEPAEGKYQFDWLDRLMDLLARTGIYADLATATAAQPAWASVKYPDILPVDEYGRRLAYGSRQSYCPNSGSYRRLAAALVRAVADHYAGHPALAFWHVNNEYGCHVAACYCEACAEAFRSWLKARYETLEALNEAWGTSFWSQRYYRWEEIAPPRATSTFKNPGQVLDYQRFMSDSLLACFVAEAQILREMSPGVPVTTNFPPDQKPLDGYRWAREMDFVSWNSYPDPVPSAARAHDPSAPALGHDLMRSLKGGQPFVLTEQAPSQVNWRDINLNKRPGIMRLWSWQAVAHGADGLLFFQWRQSRRGAERFHSGMINNDGSESSRVFREVAALGRELEGCSELAGSRVEAQVALLFDYETWWAVDQRPAPSADLFYLDQVRHLYAALFSLNLGVDLLPLDGELEDYMLVVAPTLMMMKSGIAERLDTYVRDGGNLVCTFFSGITDECGGLVSGGSPGPLREVLGLSVEELDPLKPGMENRVDVVEPFGVLQGSYRCSLWCDVLNATTARPLALYGEDYYRGRPAVTVNEHGSGRAFYLATHLESRALRDLFRSLAAALRLSAPFPVPEGVELSVRRGGRSSYLFVLNHNPHPVQVDLARGRFRELLRRDEVSGTLALEANGVAVLAGAPEGFRAIPSRPPRSDPK